MSKKLIALLISLHSVFSFGQSFSLHLTTDSVVRGFPGYALEITGVITNLTTHPIDLDAIRTLNPTMSGWQTTFCLDVCYNPNIDSAQVTIAAGDTQGLIFSFYSNPQKPDSGHAQLKIKNHANPSELTILNFYAVTDSAYTGIKKDESAVPLVSVYPNPLVRHGTIDLKNYRRNHPGAAVVFTLFDLSGKGVKTIDCAGADSFLLSRDELAAGTYIYRLTDRGKEIDDGKIVISNESIQK